jgi:hypothetical protein
MFIIVLYQGRKSCWLIWVKSGVIVDDIWGKILLYRGLGVKSVEKLH